MKTQNRIVSTTLFLICLLALGVTSAMAQGPTRDPLAGLKRALTQANAPALTATQETALTALITAFKDAQPDDPDAALVAARDAYEAAILAGNQTAANAQAVIISNRIAALTNTRLQDEAKFDIAVLAILKNGGQFIPLQTKFGDDRVLALVGSLAGGGFGGPGGGPGGPGGHH
ncbi:MAG TPA: hypothetical protein PKA34_05155 [Blastocatellia bacterium]|nr:hypothetical protein [Blastocatellia bacterium]HNG30129.1 hypothetical protein [Blastocatellia bacterium]